MTNAVANVSVNPIMELMPIIDVGTENTKFTGFDALLNSLLGNSSDNKESDENSEKKMSELYAGLFGALLANKQEVLKEPIELPNDLQISMLDNTEPTVNTDLSLKPSDEQVQVLLDKIAEGINNGTIAIDSKVLQSHYQNSQSTGEEIPFPIINTENDIKQISMAIYDLIQSKSVDKAEPEFLKIATEILSSALEEDFTLPMAKENSQEKIQAKTADAAEKVSPLFIPKEFVKGGIKQELYETEPADKILTDLTTIKIIETGQSASLSSKNTEKDNGFNLDKIVNNDKQDGVTLEPKQSFDFYVFQKNEPISENNISALIGKSEKIAEVVENHIIRSATFTDINGKQEFELQLKPEFLGKIVIKLQNSDDGMKVKIFTSNLEVKEILSNQSVQMQDVIKNQGVDLKNVEVVYTGLSNGNSNLQSGNKYKSPNKKNITTAKGEYEQAIIGGISEASTKMPNYNGSVSYLV